MTKKLLLMFLYCALPILTYSQNITLSGKVTDTKGELLYGANVMIADFNLGSSADLDGKFKITIPASMNSKKEISLKASFIGFKQKTTKVLLGNNNIEVDFVLEEDIFLSDEVVVTGIASKTSKSVAEVAVSRISAAELTSKQSFQGLSQLLTGKISGVKVNASSGNVGSGWNFLVRGGGGFNGTQPIIFIDGVKVENMNLSYYSLGGSAISTLANVNTADIENIEFLKGPAASSTYGTNASNGVVVITTKSGKLGKNAGKSYSIDYNFNFGVNQKAFDFPLDFMNADTVNQILDTPGNIREHTLGISGGNNDVRYFASIQNRFESGLIPFQNYQDRTAFRLNLTAVPSNNLVLKFSSYYAWSKLRRPPSENLIYGWMLNALSYYPAYVTTKRPAIEAVTDISKLNNVLVSAGLTYTPIANFEINANAGVDFNGQNQDRLYPFGYQYNQTIGTRAVYSRNSRQMSFDFNAKYTFKDIFTENLNITATAGSQLVSRNTVRMNIDVQEFGHEKLYDIASAKTVTGRGDLLTENRDAGIYGSASFNYVDTYFGTATVRKDYTSSAGQNTPSITYPSASFAVRLDKFDIFPQEINLFKIRAAYGESGQLPNSSDGLPLTFQSTSGASGVGAAFNGIGNPGIVPERIKEIEFGIETEFLNIFSLELSYYAQNATNSIFRSNFPSSSGLGDYTYPYNVGSVENSGIEALLRINPIREADYDLSLSLIWNYQTSKVKDIGDVTERFLGYMGVLKPGWRKFQYYEYITTGAVLDPVTGKYTTHTTSPTQVDLGNPFPDHSGSFSVNFRFLKDFNFYASGEFALNNKVFSYNIRRAVAASSWYPVEVMKAQLGLTSNAKNITPLTPKTEEYVQVANEYAKMGAHLNYGNYVYDADYLILREVSLSYDFTNLISEFIPKTYISGMEAGLTVRNALKFSKYSMDFESNYSGGNIEDTGIDFAVIPQPRTISFWLRLKI